MTNNKSRRYTYFLCGLVVAFALILLPTITIHLERLSLWTTNIQMKAKTKTKTKTKAKAKAKRNNGTVENDVSETHPTHPISPCTRSEIRKGRWKAVNRSTPTYIPTIKWESTCFHKGGSREGELQQGSPFLDSEWTVEDADCVFRPFDLNRYCHSIQNRTIAFLGDSITWQQYRSLFYMTKANQIYESTPKLISLACNNTSKLYWLRSNAASVQSLQTTIEEVDPDVIVLNRGIHYVDDQTLLSELTFTLDRLLDWQKDCKDRGRSCILFWRTTATGFPDCDKFSSSSFLDNTTLLEETLSNHDTNDWFAAVPKRQNFHWWDIPQQNKVVENLIQQYIKRYSLNLIFLDFYEMAALRPDNHIDKKDCLHWCLPGPIDAANALLLHFLEIASSDDV